jgi:colanic acid/amylovoran biosynthesis glycosyltransferase
MRLAVFTSQFPGRVNTFFARDVRALLEAGFDIEIFPIYPLDASLWRYVPDCLNEKILPRNKVHHLSLHHVVHPKLVGRKKYSALFQDIVRVSASATKFGVESLAKSVYALGKGMAWAREFPNNFDHVLAYWGNYAATCAYLYNRLSDQPVPFSMFLHAGTDLYRTQVFLDQKLLYADNIIVVCEFNRNFIRELYPDLFHLIAGKIRLHHLGLDLAEFPYQPGNRPRMKVLGVGALEKYKGFDYLLQAAGELIRRGIEIEVELVGDGKEREALKALTGKLDLSDRVSFRGWLPPHEVKDTMKRATLLVHPSIGLGDAVPTVIKESMALGTPVVASSIAGIPELLDDGRCGVLVPPRNVEALAGAIQGCLDNQATRRKYADTARQYAEQKFDTWRNGLQLAEVIRSTKRRVEGSTRECSHE